MQFLTVARGPDQGREFLIDSGKTYKVGSDDGADIVLTDPRVLGEHCSLSAEDGSILLTDLTASAGTFVGDKRVKRGRLPHGTAFRIGDSVLVVKVKHATPAARAAAPKPPLERVTLQSPLLGKIIGGYKFNEVVGRGGMGTVFRATQLSLHREVAVKVLAQKHEDDDAFVEQFINEARAAAQLIHHNVVQVYDAGREGKLSYFSMEFMAHGSVEEHLEREGKIPWEEAILMVLDAAHGLEFAQEKGIVHRDIKPDNLMIDEKGRVKIADLGLAKHDRKAGGTKQEVIGTPHFIPPEQALGKDVDHRADLYSLGATFFRIITGRTLFTGNTAKEIVLKHIHEAWPAASSVEPSIPDELDLAISRMLAKNPDDRPQSATEVISELESICAHHGIKGAVIKTGVSKRVLVPLVLLLLAAIGVTTHFVTKDPEFLEDTASKEAAARAQEEARRDRDAAAAAKRGERAQSVRAAHGALAGRELAQSRIRSLDETFDDEKSEAVREKAWRDVAQAYEDFAEDPANQELDVDDVLKMAAADATRINYRLDKLKASAHDYRAQLKAQLSEIENTTKTLLTAADNHVKARKYSRAIQAVEAGATGKPKSKDPLRAFLGWEWVSPVDASTRRKAVEIEAITEKLKGSREALKNKRDEAAAKAGEDSKRVHEQVDQLTAGEDDAQWDRAIAELRTVEELFGEAEGDAKPPRIWPLVRDARSRRTKLQITLNEDRERSLKADRQAIFDVVRKHSTLSPVAQFNYVQDLRLQRALEVYRGVHGELSSERYRAWVQERIGLLLWTEWLLKRLRADIEQSSSRSKQPALVSLDLELPRPGQKPRLGRLVRFDKKHKPASAGEINFKPRRNREEVRHLGEFPMDWVYDNVFHHEGKPRWARLTPDLQFALGAVAFETFQYRAARDHFQALAKDATYGEVATKLAERARLEDRAFTEYERLCKMVESEPDSTKLKALEAELGTFGRRHPGVAFLLQVLSPQNARNTEFVGSDPVTVPLPPPPPAPPTSPQ